MLRNPLREFPLIELHLMGLMAFYNAVFSEKPNIARKLIYATSQSLEITNKLPFKDQTVDELLLAV